MGDKFVGVMGLGGGGWGVRVGGFVMEDIYSSVCRRFVGKKGIVGSGGICGMGVGVFKGNGDGGWGRMGDFGGFCGGGCRIWEGFVGGFG